MSAQPSRSDIHDELMAVLKRRGYLQPSYEIYGGVAGFYDYGPLGASLKRNLEDLWRRFFVLDEGMAEIQCPTISPEQVFRASGHLEKFADTVVECVDCGTGTRGDHLVRNEWRRLGQEIASALRKGGGKSLIVPIEEHVEKLRVSADRDPGPANIRAILDGSAEDFQARPDDAPDEVVGARLLWHGRDEDVEAYVTEAGFRVFKAGKTLAKGAVQCPGCAAPLAVEKARIDAFNLMFKTNVGPGSGAGRPPGSSAPSRASHSGGRAGYLRPETAQGMFMDFNWLYRYFREKLPFGATQVGGKAYRNEISPRQALLRLREFHQMEAEVFFDPENKTWPGFARLAAKELNLLPREEEDVRRMRMEDAVEKGIIANGALGYFIALTADYLEAAGIPEDIVRFRQHGVTEKAHYSTDTWDAEFLSPRFGWVEIVGIADRTDYDLKAHERVSGQKLRAMRRFPEPREEEVNRFVPIPPKLGPLFKQKAGPISEKLRAMEAPDAMPDEISVEVDGETYMVPGECVRIEKRVERVEGEWYVPHVVEPSFGVDRIFYAVVESAWSSEKEWTSLKLSPEVAPVKCGVFPLMAKDDMDTIATEIDRELRNGGIPSQYDDGGAIGRRYARQDEIGTPYCVTVDYDTKEDGTVTLRERDSGAQKRLPRERLLATLQALVAGRLAWGDVEGALVQSSS